MKPRAHAEKEGAGVRLAVSALPRRTTCVLNLGLISPHAPQPSPSFAQGTNGASLESLGCPALPSAPCSELRFRTYGMNS
jgi:hypothetical protein